MQTHPRELWLLRHAKAEPYQTNDYDRQLASKGIKQMGRIGQLMSNSQSPDLIISSPALRARQTTQLFCQHLALSFDQVQWQQSIYEASTSQLIKVLQESPSAHIVLLIGHNPGFEGVYEYLTGGLTRAQPRSFNNYTIPTATLVQINMPEDWSSLVPGCATLQDVIFSK